MGWSRGLVALVVAVVLGAACSTQAPEDAVGAPGEFAQAPVAQLASTGSDGAASDGITVTGTGRVAGVPDTLRVTLGVAVERAQIQEALNAANAAAVDLIAALQEAGVDEADIQTVDFSVQPTYEETASGEPEVRGYEVRNVLEVAVRDVERAGAVLQAAMEAAGDAARVQGMRFDLEDNAALVEGARERAFAEARAKAEQYAELAGRELGPLVSVSEQSATPPPAENLARAEAAAADVPVQPGRSEVSVSLTAVWALD